MEKENIRVLVCDDSIFMRRAITRMLTVPGIEVIDTASNGLEACQKAIEYQPDIITMDFEMPIMNGLEALKQIMDENPLPVLMFSTHTSDRAEVTLEALSLGAVDFLTKSQSITGVFSLKTGLITKVLEIGGDKTLKEKLRRRRNFSGNFQQRAKQDITLPAEGERLAFNISQRLEEAKRKKFTPKQQKIGKRPNPEDIKAIAIGISTGGPVALMELLPHIPGGLPVPILIAQHMPPHFTKSLADRLNSKSELYVTEAADGDKLQPGYVYIAPGGRQMTVNKRLRITISDEPADELYKPSVNILINSLVDTLYDGVIGIIMTGMGHDGLEGLKRLSSAGGYVISQDIESCVVPGMPKSVIDAGIADEIYHLSDMADAISSFFSLSAL